MNLSFSRQKSKSLRLTRVMRCRMGLEPDDPALLERDGHDPDPCQFRTSRDAFVFKNIAHSRYNTLKESVDSRYD